MRSPSRGAGTTPDQSVKESETEALGSPTEDAGGMSLKDFLRITLLTVLVFTGIGYQR